MSLPGPIEMGPSQLDLPDSGARAAAGSGLGADDVGCSAATLTCRRCGSSPRNPLPISPPGRAGLVVAQGLDCDICEDVNKILVSRPGSSLEQVRCAPAAQAVRSMAM